MNACLRYDFINNRTKHTIQWLLICLLSFQILFEFCWVFFYCLFWTQLLPRRIRKVTARFLDDLKQKLHLFLFFGQDCIKGLNSCFTPLRALHNMLPWNLTHQVNIILRCRCGTCSGVTCLQVDLKNKNWIHEALIADVRWDTKLVTFSISFNGTILTPIYSNCILGIRLDKDHTCWTSYFGHLESILHVPQRQRKMI